MQVDTFERFPDYIRKGGSPPDVILARTVKSCLLTSMEMETTD